MANDRQPLYLRIQEHFKQLIVTGTMEENNKIPTEKQLMEQFGVSRMTVTNALTQLAKDGYIYRIPGRGSFVGPGLRLQSGAEAEKPQAGGIHRNMIGFILPLLEDFFAIRLLRGIHSQLEGSDYYVSIVLTNNNKARETEAIQELVKQGAAGLIIFPIDAESYNEEILALKLRKYPFVLVDRYLPGFDTNYVCSDNFLGALTAVNHLWELGHREIAVCSDIPRSTITVQERIRGYMEALTQKGAMINPSLILTDFNLADPIPHDNHPLFLHIKNRQATAYIALNLKLGMHIASLVQKLGMRIPGDISILTFDNPASGLDGMTEFTHIEQHEEEIGKKSAEILLKTIDNQERLSKPAKLVIQPNLVIRESTGPLS